LVFPNGAGKPTNQSNLRRHLWLPLKKRAGVRCLDLYSLRHTFASLGRTAGESAFNVARMMGHARSTLADQVYVHSTVGHGERGGERDRTGTWADASAVIAGGTRDVRGSLDDASEENHKNVVSL
jgi:integrase